MCEQLQKWKIFLKLQTISFVFLWGFVSWHCSKEEMP